VAFLGLAGTQLFVKPVVGIADNRDFAKVLGRLDVCDGATPFLYVTPQYRISPECHWDGHLTSSESIFAFLILQTALWTHRDHFSIQAAGKAHLSVELLALCILLWALHRSRPALRFTVPPLLILIFSDVAYVAYLNSFYMDAASLVFLLLTVSLAVAAVTQPRRWVAIAFGISAVLFVMSKSQHALLGPMVAVLAVWLGFGAGRKSVRWWLASAGAIVMASAAMISQVPDEYKAQGLYNLIFFRFAAHVSDPQATLEEVGLGAAEVPWVGTHSYAPNVPVMNPEWQSLFLQRTSYWQVALYYLRHPSFTSSVLWESLTIEAPGIRPDNLGNYRQADQNKPYAHATHFALWSNWRTNLFRTFPLYALIIYVLVAAGCTSCMLRPALASRWPFYPVALVLAACGTVEFLGSVLLDCLETGRHLFLFQAITEMMIVSLTAGVLSLRGGGSDSDRASTEKVKEGDQT